MTRIHSSVQKSTLPLTWMLTLLLSVAPATTQAQVQSHVYIVNHGAGSVTRIDADTWQVTQNEWSAGPFPVGFASSPDGRFLYAANRFGRVTIVDVLRGPVGSIPVPFGLLTAIAMAPDGRHAYVALDNTNPGTVVTIDTTTNQVVGTPFVVGSRPVAIVVAPDGTRAFVANAGSNTVSILTFASHTVSTVAVGINPLDLTITTDGRTVYVANADSQNVTPIDVATSTPGAPTGTSTRPVGIAVTPDGREVWVANEDPPSASFIVVGVPRGVGRIDLDDDAFQDAKAIAISADGRFGWVVSSRNFTTTRVLTLNRDATEVGDFIYTLNGEPRDILINPSVLVDTPTGAALTIANDTELTPRGFGRFVTFNGGTLRLTGNWTTTRGLSIWNDAGIIDTGSRSATIGGDVVYYDSGLIKRGSGTLRLAGTNTQGTSELAVTVLQGTLLINGTDPTQVFVERGATFGGTGHAGFPVARAGSRITPGDDGPGVLRVEGLRMEADSTLVVDLQGQTPGTGYDQIDAIGTAHIDGATLSLRPRFPAPLFQPPLSTPFTIVRHAQGQFAGLPEGAFVDSGSGLYRISYTGGPAGDDVVVTFGDPNDAPPTISPIADQTMRMGTTLAPIAFTIGDDHGPNLLSITTTSSNRALIEDTGADSGLIATCTGATCTLTLQPDRFVSGTATITVRVFDAQQSTAISFTLTVTPPTYYLAEGATGAFFDTDLVIANPTEGDARVRIAFLTEDGRTITDERMLAALSRIRIRVDELPGLDATSFSTVVTSIDGLALIVERTMWWDASGYGAHTEKATDGAASQWYFAEGSQGFFSTYFLLVNPSATANTAHVTYLREGLPPIVRDYPLLPSSRFTIDAGSEPGLINTSFGARVVFDQPGVAERAMYFGPGWTGGHESAGVTALSPRWFLAEGATGSYFTTFVLLANPGDEPANARVTYLPATGTPVTRTYTIGAARRLTINIATEDPSLVDAAVATDVDADRPIVVERAQYWPNPTWIEAHNSFGVTETGTLWGLAEGRVGGPHGYQTYILLANPGTQEAPVTIFFLRASGGAPIEKHFIVAPTSRFNVPINGPNSLVPELANEEFSAIIDAREPIVVERSLYSNANGITWAAGTNATATRLP